MGDEEEFARASILRRSMELILVVLSLSHSIRVFAGKCQLIPDKLEELHGGLVTAENYVSGESPSLSGLVVAVAATAAECHDLCRRCVDVSYSGKLLMQSDLDMAFAKLDVHARKLSKIYKKGILTNGFVLEDEKYVKVVVDVAHLLVGFLGFNEAEIQEESAKVVYMVVGFDSYKGVLIGAGVIAPLVKVLDCGSNSGKVVATRCLVKLTENSNNAWCVSAHGGSVCC